MIVKFKDILEIRNGKNQKAVEDIFGEYPIYGSGGIMGYANSFICPKETVIIGRKGSINNPIFSKTPFWNVDTAFGLIANREKIFPKYLFYFCVYFDFNKLNTTVTIPSLTKANLLEIDIKVPPLQEQHRIANILDKVTELIDLRKQQLAKLEELVKARFVEMFEKTSSDDYMTLEQCCISINGGCTPSMHHSEYYGGDIPFIKSGDIKEEYISHGSLYLTEYALKKTNAKYIESGSIIVVLRSGILKHKLPIAITLNKVVINQDIKSFYIKDSFTQEYIVWYIKSKEKYLLSKSRASTVDNIESRILYNLPILIVSIEKQREFSAFVKKKNMIEKYVKQALSQLETLKASLMQEYFG